MVEPLIDSLYAARIKPVLESERPRPRVPLGRFPVLTLRSVEISNCVQQFHLRWRLFELFIDGQGSLIRADCFHVLPLSSIAFTHVEEDKELILRTAAEPLEKVEGGLVGMDGFRLFSLAHVDVGEAGECMGLLRHQVEPLEKCESSLIGTDRLFLLSLVYGEVAAVEERVSVIDLLGDSQPSKDQKEHDDDSDPFSQLVPMQRTEEPPCAYTSTAMLRVRTLPTTVGDRVVVVAAGHSVSKRRADVLRVHFRNLSPCSCSTEGT